MRWRTARSRRASASGSPRRTAGVTCGAAMPLPATRANSRASRSASSVAAWRNTTTPPMPKIITAASAAIANFATAPATEPSSVRCPRRGRRRAHVRPAEVVANEFIGAASVRGARARDGQAVAAAGPGYFRAQPLYPRAPRLSVVHSSRDHEGPARARAGPSSAPCYRDLIRRTARTARAGPSVSAPRARRRRWPPSAARRSRAASGGGRRGRRPRSPRGRRGSARGGAR